MRAIFEANHTSPAFYRSLVVAFSTFCILAPASLALGPGSGGAFSSARHDRVAAGDRHTLAVREGIVWAWGNNDQGQLGDGTTHLRDYPVFVQGLTQVTSVAAGGRHSLALRADGTVLAWGSNTQGQLGADLTPRDAPFRSLPQTVETSSGTELDGVVAIAAGGDHSLALRADGTVWAWGDNTQGQLGDNEAPTSRRHAVQVMGFYGILPARLHDVVAIAAGRFHNLALDSSGLLWAWGDNSSGQVGNGGVSAAASLALPIHRTIRAIAAGGFHSLALDAEGRVLTWGSNSWGQLGDGTLAERNAPVFAIDHAGRRVAGAVDVAAGEFHSAVIEADRSVRTWGRGSTGQLGRGNLKQSPRIERDSRVTTRTVAQYLDLGRPSPQTPAPAPLRVKDVAAGAEHTVALALDGSLWVWGENQHGQLGNNTRARELEPFPVYWKAHRSVAVGQAHSLAVKGGRVWSWGGDSSGQLGGGDSSGPPGPPREVLTEDASPLSDVVAVDAGAFYSLALTVHGQVWAWGDNSDGQLGNGVARGTIPHATQVQRQDASRALVPLNDVVSISAGHDHGLAVRSDGTVWAWGRNDTNQLGNGSLLESPHAVQVQALGMFGIPAPLSYIVAVSAGDGYSLALDTGGAVWAWGLDTYGRLGLGNRCGTDAKEPYARRQAHDRKFVSLAANTFHSLAAADDGRVFGWGLNSTGELGKLAGGCHPNSVVSTYLMAPQEVLHDYHPGLRETTRLAQIVLVRGGYNAARDGHFSFAVARDQKAWHWGATRSRTPSFADCSGAQVMESMAHPLGDRIADIAGSRDRHSLFVEWRSGAQIVSGCGKAEGGRLGPVKSKVIFFSLLPVFPRATVERVAGGSWHTVAVKRDGSVWTWGSDQYGQLGDGDSQEGGPRARRVRDETGAPVSHAVAVASGDHHGVVTDGRAVLAWGTNDFGQLGDLSTTARKHAVKVRKSSSGESLTDVLDVAAGRFHSLALTADGSVWGWGRNDSGQLGVGHTRSLQFAQPVVDEDGRTLREVIAIAAGDDHGLALKADGSVWAWGWNEFQQLGRDTPFLQLPYSTRAQPVLSGDATLIGVRSIAAGWKHSLAIGDDGRVWLWGGNDFGQLGDVSTAAHEGKAVLAGELSEIVALSAGDLHSLALRADGTVRSWGTNWSGQLGDGSTTAGARPRPVLAVAGAGPLANVVAITSGGGHSLAVRPDGSLLGWGRNGDRQLGSGDPSPQLLHPAPAQAGREQ